MEVSKLKEVEIGLNEFKSIKIHLLSSEPVINFVLLRKAIEFIGNECRLSFLNRLSISSPILIISIVLLLFIVENLSKKIKKFL